MTLDRQKLLFHSLVACHAPMMTDLEIVRDVGFDGVELSSAKMRAFLDAGFSEAELSDRLRGFDIPGIGFLLDIERHGPDEASLIAEAEEIFHLANLAGAPAVQILTGPVNVQAVVDHAERRPSGLYKGVLDLPRDEQIALTARNMARLADLAAQRGLILYLESLGWTPLNSIADQVELIDRTGRDNVKMIVDYWHCYVSGDTPDEVAKLDKDIIYGVHVCDSLTHVGGVPNEAVLRDVPTGEGVLNLQSWTDAVKATGFIGWWSPELFCRRQQQENSFQVASELKTLLEELVLDLSR
jgi:sugar phosphate isomerase/epimerase